MADATITQGDTWPPQRFRLEDADGNLVDFSGAEKAEVLIRGVNETKLIEGTAVPIAPPEEDDDGTEWNGRYVWQEGDTDNVADDYDVEIRVTWGPGENEGDPPKVQTFPTKNPRPTLEIVKSNRTA